MSTRTLSPAERNVVEPIFSATLPYARIHVTDGLGFQERPFTLNMGTGPSASYYLHVGPGAYSGLNSSQENRRMMVHELTHVWQAHHSAWTPSYIFRSAIAQLRGIRAYGYRVGQNWSQYNVEQQASIVEDWFSKGMNESDPRFRYIRDHIRAGRTR